ncbi:reverse transcriptase domain-containing protein [Tanacetum coccineum]
MEVEEELPEPWTLFTDRSSCVDGSGAGLILTNLEGAEFTYALRFRFEATNKEAEYEALIAGLRIAEEMGVKNLQANVDSRLVANQVNGTYIANETELKEKSINELEVLAVVEEEGNTWMTPIYEYLTKETLPVEVNKVRAVRRSQTYPKKSVAKADPNHIPMAILQVGNRHSRTFPGRSCKWISRKSKPKLRGRNQGKASRKKQELDGIISHVLWAHRTMIKSSNEDTPFSLTYGTGAVIPAKLISQQQKDKAEGG